MPFLTDALNTFYLHLYSIRYMVKNNQIVREEIIDATPCATLFN